MERLGSEIKPVSLSFLEREAETVVDPSKEKPPIIFMHGVLASAESFQHLLSRTDFVPDRRIFSLNLRNHGSSPHSDTMNYAAMAEDVRDFLRTRQISKACIIGHSMGGKVGMVFALESPELVSELIVVDLAPIHYGDPMFEKNLPTGAIVAMSRIQPELCTDRDQVDQKLQEQGIMNKRVREFILGNLVAHDLYPGRFKWRVNVSVLLKSMDRILEFPQYESKTFLGPSLFLRGEKSIYVTNDEAENAIQQLFPKAAIKTVPRAGHWLFSEVPDEFTSIVNDFLQK
eukprot:jgi/Galph1/1060/GphlegSOOS_G5870.1